jgi:predicted RNase H-like HicB family nuclease
MQQRNPIELTGFFIKDHEENFTGFFSQFPEAVSQGKTLEEAEKKLFSVLPDILNLKQKMSEEELPEDNTHVFKKSYSYQPA